MENFSLNYKNPQIILDEISYEINNNDINHKKSLVYNSSVRNYNNININDLNEDKNIYNRQLNQKSEKDKDMQLNKITNIPIDYNNLSHSYIPFSSRAHKKLKNNFIFYNNKEIKTINKTNASNIIQDKIIIGQYPNNERRKNNIKDNRILCKQSGRQNYSICKNAIHPFLDEFNMINQKFGNSHLYQTPKNILAEQKNEKGDKLELSRKTKYRKIFNEKEKKEDFNLLNKTREKNGYDSYNNILKKSNNNYIKLNSRDCMTPFFANRFIPKFNHMPRNINKNNLNINTDINNKKNSKIVSHNNQTMQNINEVKSYEKNKLYFISNNKEILENNEEENKSYINIIKFRNKFFDINNNEIKKQRDRDNVLLSDNFNDINSNLYSNRYTYFDNKKNKNNLFLNHLENAKRLSNKQICMNNNTDIIRENKENINNNSKFNQDSYLINDSINHINIEFNLNKSIQNKLQNRKQKNIRKNNKNSSFKINNCLAKKVIRKKVNKINNSDILKGDFSLTNKLKQDELGINSNTEIKYYNLKNSQNISLVKKNNNNFFRVKGDLNSFKQKNNNSNFIINKNKATVKINESQKDDKNNISKANIKNNENINYFSNNLKLNIRKNLTTNQMQFKEGNIDKRKESINTNFDNFLKNSSLLNNSNNNLLYSQQSQTTLNSSNINKFNSNEYKSKLSNLEKYPDENKYIFSLYYSIYTYNKNRNIKISAICFDPENCSFKTKSIDNIYFKKNFNESINKTNNSNKSIYLIKKDDFFIVTGGNCNKFYKYIFKENKLEQKFDLKYNHSNGGLISYNEQIICLSGNFNKKVEVFSENDNIWSELPEMQIERSYFSTCIIKNRFLFVFFGYNYPNRKYLDTIEFFDILNYNINTTEQNCQKEKSSVYWRYLKYNYFNSSPSFNNINLIGALAINYNDEKIILFGGKNCLNKENNNGYYQFILNENDFDENDVNSYIEKVIVKDMNNYFFSFDYKYLEDLNRNNIMKEHAFVAFDNSYNIHLLKLSTMNHEIYHFNNK